MSQGDEAARVAVLRSYAVLDTPAERRFDDLTRLAALVCRTPTALITLIDDRRQWFKSRFNFVAEQTDRAIAFCTHTIEMREPMVVRDALGDPRFARNPLVTDPPNIRFYAGVPLVMPSGHVIGTLAVIDYEPRELATEQLAGLEALAQQVVAQLELRRLLAEQKRLQREGAERFEVVARATNDAVWDWDLITNSIWWNEGLRTLFGYPPNQIPTIHTWAEYIHPEDAARVTGSLYAAIHSGNQQWLEAYRFLRHDGTYADILDRGYVIRAADGTPIRMIGAMLDVTERRRLEDQLRQAQKMDALGQLSGGVAHDFNNLLTVIQVNAALLARTSRNTNVREHTDAISEATERAAALTRQLLMVSRKQIMQQRPVDLNAVVANLTRMLRRVLGEDIALVAQCQPRLPLVAADINLLEQVILNLVVNARDAMPRGGQLTIVTGSAELAEATQKSGFEVAAGTYVWVSVSDTGTGIATEHLPHLFEPFFTTKKVGRGTGLGLATAYGIVRQHRGWIEVDSELGRGTSFRLFIPATEGVASQPVDTTSAEDELPSGTETVLVVEDEHALRDLVVSLLASCGYTVLHAGSGIAALELWKQHASRIQLVLTDVVMPGGVSGRELAERLRAERPDLPVVYTSGYSPDLTGSGEALVEGVNFLQKPYQPAALARAVRNCLDRARAT
jgi:PAS domain S-box-containing protein